MYKKLYFLFLFAALLSIRSFGQGLTDPGRASLYWGLTKTASSAVSAQNAVIIMNQIGHQRNALALKRENKFLKEYRSYLITFGNILAVAANMYGIYYESDRCIKFARETRSIVSRCPDNTIAVALSPTKNKIYEEVMEQGIKVIGDMELALPKKIKKKNTKKANADDPDSVSVWNYADVEDRIQMLTTVRQDIQKMNHLLYACNRLMRYTTMLDTWYEFLGSAPVRKTRSIKEVSKDCTKRWSSHLKVDIR